MLALWKVEDDLETESSEEHIFKMLSILFALSSGLITFVSSVDMFYSFSLGFTSMQMNIDSNFVYALGLLPFFLYE